MPERRIKCLATDISHCTELVIDLSLKLPVSWFFLLNFFSVDGKYMGFEDDSVSSCESPV